jgi:hypothetical protein
MLKVIIWLKIKPEWKTAPDPFPSDTKKKPDDCWSGVEGAGDAYRPISSTETV